MIERVTSQVGGRNFYMPRTGDHCPIHGDELREIRLIGTDGTATIVNGDDPEPGCCGAAACLKCLNAAADRDQGVEQRARVDRDRRAAIRARFRQSGLGEVFELATFETFTPDNQHDAGVAAHLRAFAAQIAAGRKPQPPCRLLLGIPGCGKTHLAAAMFHALPDRAVLYKERDALLSDVLRLAYADKSGVGLEQAAREATRADLIICDDWLRGYEQTSTPRSAEALSTLLNEAWRSRTPLLLIRNIAAPNKQAQDATLDQIRHMVAPEIWDRLRSPEMLSVLRLTTTKSHRGKG